MKKNCIIDTDPGVDDCAAIALSLYDEVLDIALITSVCGNISLEKSTRNALHLLEKFHRQDIPVAKGAKKPLKREPSDATFIHQKEGMGGYTPPESVSTKPIKLGAVEAMYEVIKAHKNNIYIVAIGPHTNIALLIKKHPDVVGMIKHIYTEGCSPYGWENEPERWKYHISFNASSDPEALKIVVESGIPITFIPSRMGREFANFTEEEVSQISKINKVGNFFYQMYSKYWEPGYDDKRIATNDTCACLALRFPKLFKTIKVKFEVDTDKQPGKTIITPDKKGHINLAVGVNKKKMHKRFFNAIKKLDWLKFE